MVNFLLSLMLTSHAELYKKKKMLCHICIQLGSFYLSFGLHQLQRRNICFSSCLMFHDFRQLVANVVICTCLFAYCLFKIKFRLHMELCCRQYNHLVLFRKRVWLTEK